MISRIRNEPAMGVAILVALANLVGMSVSPEGIDAIEAIVESLTILAGGGVVRQNVTPVWKLRDARRSAK